MRSRVRKHVTFLAMIVVLAHGLRRPMGDLPSGSGRLLGGDGDGRRTVIGTNGSRIQPSSRAVD